MLFFVEIKGLLISLPFLKFHLFFDVKSKLLFVNVFQIYLKEIDFPLNRTNLIVYNSSKNLTKQKNLIFLSICVSFYYDPCFFVFFSKTFPKKNIS